MNNSILRRYVCLFCLFTTSLCIIDIGGLKAQSFWFGPKVCPTLAWQKWQDFEPNPTVGLSYDFFIESYKEESPSSLYAQLGYHRRGSSLRAFNWANEPIGTQGFKFNNIVLELGAKKLFDVNLPVTPYYILGVRAEYTLNTNLKQYDRFASPFYPNDIFVNHWVAGVSFGGGFEWIDKKELFRPFLEITLNPDFTNQYYQQPLRNVIDNRFGNGGTLIDLGERTIRNLSLEVKFGFKFLRKVIYY